MRIAARWLGGGSIVLGTLAALLMVVSLYPGALERLSRADAQRAEQFQSLAK
ncbi:MAG TPA: hypothetical protein VFV99_06315 [Kofleriaceae bacterium]|nr:hypothetical protein [Kofleriaceae bacterium]